MVIIVRDASNERVQAECMLSQDVALSLSMLSGDSVTDKLDWTFRLYDLKHDGVITRDELLDIITSVYDLVGDFAEPQQQPSTVQQHADDVFQV